MEIDGKQGFFAKRKLPHSSEFRALIHQAPLSQIHTAKAFFLLSLPTLRNRWVTGNVLDQTIEKGQNLL